MHRSIFAFLFLTSGALGFAQAAPAQDSCSAGRIAEVVIENHSIFDPASLPDEGPFLWAYRLANAVHVRTREEFIADELLFGVGECFDPQRLEESARILRTFRFIAQAEASTQDIDAQNRRVLVTTRDEWTTKIALNVEVDEGIHLRGGSLFEENLLGRGITLGLYTIDRGARRDVGGVLEVPRLRGTPFDALLGASRNRGGGSAYASFVHPIRGEQPGMAIRQRMAHRRDLFAYVLPQGHEFSHLTIPDLVQQVEVSMARRVGTPGRLYLFGGGLSYERVRIGGRDGIQGIRDLDFSDREEVTGPLADSISPQSADRRALRLNLLLAVRRLSFTARRGLDSVTGLQDLPVGLEVTTALGRSVGGTERSGPNDLFARSSLLAGGAANRLVGQLRLTGEGRRDDDARSAAGRWQDLLMEGFAILYWLPSTPARPTVVFRGSVLGGWNTTAPFQLTLGGQEGLRGYRDEDFPAGRRAVGSIEARFNRPGPVFDLVDLGFTVFGDVGATWAGDAPFGVDSGLRGSLGAGMRVGFPAGTSSVIRFDLAFPIGPGAGSLQPILRISAHEWIGVMRDPRSLQLDRSRRSGIRGDFAGAAREDALP